MGPPGAGKTYMSNRLAAETGVVAISAGQLLRDYARADPAVAAQMSRGELVPTALVARLVRERLAQEDARRLGFILDGFPRRLEEVEELERSFGEDAAIDAVVVLRPSDEELRRRVSARGRADDSPAVFEGRLKTYDQRTVPVIERLRARVPILVPDLSAPDKDTNYSRLRALLGPFLSGRRAD